MVVAFRTPRTAARTWWTRERVIAGLRRFYQDHGGSPTSTEEWHQLTGRHGQHGGGPGTRRPYPSLYAVLRHFDTFRQAWAAAGIDVDRRQESWSQLEDWYLREGSGLISRSELARDLHRTPDAIHRPYVERGDLPYLRGSKCVYVDPADLLVVQEIDWHHPPAELEEAALQALRERLVKLLAGQDWRVDRPFLVQPLVRTDRRWGPRLIQPGPKPIEIAAGDWVEVAAPVPRRPYCLGRQGRVHLVFWSVSRNVRNSVRSSPEPQWMARVEFSSQHGRSRGPRVTYTLPLMCLRRSAPPV